MREFFKIVKHKDAYGILVDLKSELCQFFLLFFHFPLPVPFFSPSAPTAVTDVLVNYSSTSVCVSWGPPEDNGGSPVDSYRLELQSSTGATEQVVTVGGDIDFHSFENLVANTSYM